MFDMQRQWNNKTLELLAPAGTFDIFRQMCDSACDAIYCGGQSINMRMIRKGYNLSREELKDAVDLAREKGKKIYITVNSLLDPSEVNEARDYLAYLQTIEPHGLIVQDTAVISMAQELGMTVPLHASVMMNVHNLDMIRRLEGWGISRVVLSREMSLEQVRCLSGQTDMELEYFTHGDMCAVHGSQCLYSSYLFGMSSNRGRCLKPCRWPFSGAAEPFPLAVKDLSLYSRLSDMILAGICSFKIEGRMREADFIISLINRYGEALDRFLDDPVAHARSDMQDMEPFKKRDYSTGYAFGKPGQANINRRGEGSGKFYSTGKMFSLPTRESAVSLSEASDSSEPLSSPIETGRDEAGRLSFTARVGSVEQARRVLDFNPLRIYLSAEPFAPLAPASYREIGELAALCREKGTELFLALPRMTGEAQRECFEALFAAHPELTEDLDGLLITHAGMFEWAAAKGMKLHCDATMNLYNSRAAAFMAGQGAGGWTPSLELPFTSLLALPGDLERYGAADMEAEAVLHGVPTVMYMDHDVSAAGADEFVLETDASRLRIRRDAWDRYHLLPEKEFTLLPRLAELAAAGYRRFRLELQDYGTEEMLPLLEAVRQALEEPARGAEILENLESVRGGYSYGAQKF